MLSAVTSLEGPSLEDPSTGQPQAISMDGRVCEDRRSRVRLDKGSVKGASSVLHHCFAQNVSALLGRVQHAKHNGCLMNGTRSLLIDGSGGDCCSPLWLKWRILSRSIHLRLMYGKQ
jgi:hypothetical protein